MPKTDLPLVQHLLSALDLEGINYCHWKSNESVLQALGGETDLDLLVDPAQKFQFGRLLVRLGFKKTIGRNDHRFPGVVHFYGHDAPTGRIVDLHVHYRLILGSDLLKNYELRAAPYLESARSTDLGVRLPAAEYEYVVFVMRMVLKRRLLPWLLGHPDPRVVPKTLLRGGRLPLDGPAGRELRYLRGLVGEAAVRDARTALIPGVDDGLFALCERSVGEEARRWDWLVAGFRLSRALKPLRRAGLMSSMARAVYMRAQLLMPALRKRLRLSVARRRRPRLTCRGPVIAFVGGDGSGKTTNVEALERWLGDMFEVRTFHIGKPPLGPLRILHRYLSKGIRILMGNPPENEVKPLFAIRLVLIARGRLKLLMDSKRFADNGGIVICDRYPVRGLALSEAPLVPRLDGARSRVMSFLGSIEQRYYDRIDVLPHPDRIFVLSIDPTVSIGRRPEDDPDFIRPRLEEIRNSSWEGVANVFVVDADQPLDSVLAEVREDVWELLPGWTPHVEVAGPAGSGKTTLTRILVESGSFQEHRITSLRGEGLRLLVRAIQQWWALFRFGYAKARWLAVKQVMLDLWSAQVPKSNRPVVYDQGPYFTAAFAHWLHGGDFESRWLRAWHRRYLDRTSQLLDLVIRLESSDSVLRDRLNSRPQPHIVKQAEEDIQDRFLAESRRDLDRVEVAGLGAPRFSVVTIRSDDAEPSALADQVRQLIEGGES